MSAASKSGGLLNERPSIYLAYAVEDALEVDRLYQRLVRGGCAPWLDRRTLLPGENWQLKLKQAISTADFFLACFSTRSIRKRGWFQAELSFAMECVRQIPLGQCYFIPARLDPAELPAAIRLDYQYVDLFPSFEGGVRRILATVREQQRLKAPPPYVGRKTRYTKR